MIEIDVDLALLDFRQDKLKELVEKLPANYEIEEKYELGWGVIIRKLETLSGSVDDAVCEYLKDLDHVVELIRNYNGVLRVAVYHDAVTFTCRVSSIKLLQHFSLELEISVYPSEE